VVSERDRREKRLAIEDAAVVNRTTRPSLRIVPAINDCYLILIRKHRAQ